LRLSTKILLFCYALFLPALLFGAGQDSLVPVKKIVRKAPLTILREDIASILDNPDLANAVCGVYIRSCKTGETIFKQNESNNLIPASLTKLFTTSAALNILKPDFRYSDNLYLDGAKSKRGIFTGNVILRASGDPTMSEKFNTDINDLFNNWAEKLYAAGIREIKGNLICDDRYFDSQYYAPGWSVDDLIYPFAAPVAPIAVFDNKITITINSGDSTGSQTEMSIEPLNNFVKIYNHVLTLAPDKPEEITAVRNKDYEIIELFGGLPYDSLHQQSASIEIAVNAPVLYFLNLFKQSLKSHDILLRGALLDYASAGYDINYLTMSPFLQYKSPRLIKIIENINKTSNNLAAEMVLKTIGKEGKGIGSFATGCDMVKKYCKSIGIPSNNVLLYDGSGLSRYNLLQPKYIVDLLFKIYLSKYKKMFIATLARPGKKGTLKRRMTNSRAEKRIYAKTGSMNNVTNLAGYVLTSDGEYLAFAIMVMNHNVPESLVQNIQDLICMRLATFSRKE